MKALLYAIFLLLSLPNLLAGVASLIIRHTFRTLNPLNIISDFLFQVVWGLPLAGGLFLVLLILGCVSRTRPYATLFAIVLNLTALGLVLARFGFPRDSGQAMVFLPLGIALVGFAFIAYGSTKPGRA